jgi:hypothetical protein
MKEAIRHGLKTVGCDDFRIGQKRGDGLKSLSWMGSKLFGPDEIRKVADCLGMKNYWDEPDDGLGIGWGT